MNVINILLGVVILLTGRQLFWLFVGVLGFLAGASLAQQTIRADPVWLVWLIALFVGLVGALVAVFLQRAAVALAGFVAGWLLLMNLATTFGWEFGNANWVLYLIGGIVGAVLVSVLYDWALIILSAIVGGTTIMQNLALELNPLLTILALLVLIFVGVSVQYRAMLRDPDAVTVV